MMKFTWIFTLAVIILFNSNSCSPKDSGISASATLTEQQQDLFIYSIIRYAGHLPGKANHASKWDSSYNNYYKELAKNHKLINFYRSPDSSEYFLMIRKAPSLHEKWVGIAGKLKPGDATGEIKEYEEVFRTWKMPMEQIEMYGPELFRKMVNKEDLTPYYTQNSQPKFIIEFPSEEVQFSKSQRAWMSSREDVMEPYYKLKDQSARDSAVITGRN